MLPPQLVLPRTIGGDAVALREREWLVTNGLGGYASGTVLGVPTRRHHGILVPNLDAPRGRHVALPRLDDCVEAGGGSVRLAGAELGDGRPEVEAHLHLREFRLDGVTPVWTFEVDGRVIERALLMPQGRNAVCVRWRLLDGPACRLRLRVYAGGRRQDAPLHLDEHPPGRLEPAADGDARLWRADSGIAVRMQVLAQDAAFEEAPRLERDVLLRVERERGYEHREHMHSPGEWRLTLAPGRDAAFVAQCGDQDGEGDAALPSPEELFEAERSRVAALLAAEGLAGADETERRLVLAADAFVVEPAGRRETGQGRARTVIAGYPWFGDWGRDTMIALEGLALCTGRHAEARGILRTFARYIRDGLLPNLFPEGEREALYHTVDATFWYFHAIERYVAHSGDLSLVAELYPVLADVIERHRQGTRFGIGVDPQDALVRAAAEGLQLTWMDAKVDDWVVTPRRGKPVEIQALWYNALRLMAGWGRALGAPGADAHDALAERVRTSFEARFWSPARGHLLDVVDGPDGDDASLRPNQVFALSLTHPVLDAAHRRAVLDAVARHLLTPFGLRTLAPHEPGYRPRYEGSLRERDAAYHQGTVWPWLLGHFVDAWLRVHGRDERARALLQALPAHLAEHGLGSVSEVFDAQPPHCAGGCIAQAWSVAELLRAWQATRGGDRDG
ncbi:amylo-alpha-1,6-glucosidase [Caldimonas tepidiphila]|uniref:amylo-alpha-1,6-glucosidase n=1 Tax=Caldimonas tepidiphila TaxID=2315841 RepID=UPI001F0C035C|nr:amylo-alpha-1,6-glucosidase [Caldimonas tepidiphila]